MRALSRLEPAEAPDDDPTTSARATVREVWGLAGPAIAHMLLVTLVFLVDRVLLGRYAESALASLQISSILFWTLYSVLTAFSAGTLAVVGRAIGQGDRETAARAALGSMGFAFAIGVVVAVPLVASPGTLVGLLFPEVDGPVGRDAVAYLRIVSMALPLAFVEAISAATLQASGDTRTPLAAAVVANVINLVLSAVLVFGLAGAPELGVRGAAIGTAIATAVQALILVGALFRARSPVPLRAVLAAGGRAALADPVRRVLRVSGPAFAETVVYHAAYLTFVAMIGLLGATAMAANQALVSIEAICFLSADGFGIAAAALVAQKLGAGRAAEASRAALVAAGMAMALLTACGLVFVAAPRLLVGMFSPDDAIVDAVA